MVYSDRKIETLEVSCELGNVLKQASDNATSRRRNLFEDMSFFPPICCHWRFFFHQ